MSLLPAFPALAAALVLAAAPVNAQAPRKIDAAKSHIRFVTKQMNVPVEGRFRKFDATVAFDPKKPEATKAEFEVELASIDLGAPDGEAEAQRPLWFNTQAYPKAKFVASSVKPTGPGKYEASGALTIKGITHTITTPFTLTEAAGLRTVEGQFTLKRLQFRIGEKQWADTETVADEIAVRYKFVLPL
jgi:polyisoprenoid-binding protein YceI